MSQAANALCTFAEYCLLLGKDTTNEAIDQPRIEMFVGAVSTMIEKRCGRAFIQGTFADYFEGNGTTFRYPKQWPLKAASSASLDYWSGTAWVATGYTVTVNDTETKLELAGGYVFYEGMKYKLSYTAGWLIASVPFDLKAVCAYMTSSLILSFRKAGTRTESVGDETRSYDFDAMPEYLKTTLRTYERPQFV